MLNVQSSDQGNYTLTASNPGGTIVSTNAVLTVQSPPSISTQPAPRTVNQGTSTLFSVSASGSPTLAYQWQFGGINIAGATGSFYIVSNAQFSQAGAYQVVVTNNYGSVTSTVATLTVNAPPTITSQPQGENLTVGDTVSFSVTATGSTPLNCHWLLNNAALSDNARISGSQTTQLVINGVLTSDAGGYQAVIVNSFGSTNSTLAMLAVAKATPTLTWVAPAAITYGTALSAIQLNATASQPGNFGYSPTIGSAPNAGTNLLSVVFTPSDTADYDSVTGSVNLTVSPAALTVAAADATRVYGQTNPVFTATITGALNGDVFTASASSSASPTNLPGTYPIVPSLSDTNHRLGNYSLTVSNASPCTITPAATAPKRQLRAFTPQHRFHQRWHDRDHHWNWF